MGSKKKKNATGKDKGDTPTDGVQNTDGATQGSNQNQEAADPIEAAETGKEVIMEDKPGTPEQDPIKEIQDPQTSLPTPIQSTVGTLGPAAAGSHPTKPGVEGMLVELLLASQDVIQGYQTLDKGKIVQGAKVFEDRVPKILADFDTVTLVGGADKQRLTEFLREAQHAGFVEGYTKAQSISTPKIKELEVDETNIDLLIGKIANFASGSTKKNLHSQFKILEESTLFQQYLSSKLPGPPAPEVAELELLKSQLASLQSSFIHTCKFLGDMWQHNANGAEALATSLSDFKDELSKPEFSTSELIKTAVAELDTLKTLLRSTRPENSKQKQLQEELSALNLKDESLRTDLQQSQAANTELQNKFSTLKEQHSSIAAQLATSETEKTTLEHKLALAEQQLVQLNEKASSFEAGQLQAQKKIGELQEKVQELDEANQTKQAEIEKATESSSKLKSEIASANDKANALATQVQQISAERDHLNQTVNQLETDKSNLENDPRLEQVSKMMKELESKYAQLTTQLKLETQLRIQKEKDIEEEKQAKENIERRVTELQSEFKLKSDEYERLQSEVRDRTSSHLSAEGTAPEQGSDSRKETPLEVSQEIILSVDSKEKDKAKADQEIKNLRKDLEKFIKSQEENLQVISEKDRYIKEVKDKLGDLGQLSIKLEVAQQESEIYKKKYHKYKEKYGALPSGTSTPARPIEGQDGRSSHRNHEITEAPVNTNPFETSSNIEQDPQRTLVERFPGPFSEEDLAESLYVRAEGMPSPSELQRQREQMERLARNFPGPFETEESVAVSEYVDPLAEPTVEIQPVQTVQADQLAQLILDLGESFVSYGTVGNRYWSVPEDKVKEVQITLEKVKRLQSTPGWRAAQLAESQCAQAGNPAQVASGDATTRVHQSEMHWSMAYSEVVEPQQPAVPQVDRVPELEAKLQELREENDTLEAQKQNLSGSLEQLLQQAKEVLTQIFGANWLDPESCTVSAICEETGTALDRLPGLFRTLSDQVASGQKELSEQSERHKQELKEAESGLSKAASDAAELSETKQRLSVATEEIKRLSQDKAGLQEALAAVESHKAEVLAVQGQLSVLQQQVDRVNKEKETSRQQATESSAEVARLKGQLQSAEKVVALLRQGLTRLRPGETTLNPESVVAHISEVLGQPVPSFQEWRAQVVKAASGIVHSLVGRLNNTIPAPVGPSKKDKAWNTILSVLDHAITAADSEFTHDTNPDSSLEEMLITLAKKVGTGQSKSNAKF